jgi:hypothetical protein
LLVALILLELVLGQKVTQKLLVELVVVVDLRVLFVLDVACIFAEHAVQVFFHVDFFDHLPLRILVCDDLIDLLNNCRVEG